MIPEKHVWVFNGQGGQFPGGVFSSRKLAEAWIRFRWLTGVLTAYPLDEGCFDWALRQDLITGRARSGEMKKVPLFMSVSPSSAINRKGTRTRKPSFVPKRVLSRAGSPSSATIPIFLAISGPARTKGRPCRVGRE